MQTTRLYIDGAFVAPRAGGTFEAIDPATEQAFAKIAAGMPADVDLAVKAARKAFDEGPWPQIPATERAAALRKASAAPSHSPPRALSIMRVFGASSAPRRRRTPTPMT